MNSIPLKTQVDILGLSLAAWTERYGAGIRDGKTTYGGRFMSKDQAFMKSGNPNADLKTSDAQRLVNEIHLYEHPEVSKEPAFLKEVLAKRLAYLDYKGSEEITQYAKRHLRCFGLSPHVLVDTPDFRAIAFNLEGGMGGTVLAFPNKVDWVNHPRKHLLAVDLIEQHFGALMVFIQTAVEESSQRVVLLGHGLGGAIAQLVAVWAVEFIDSINLYSPAPIPVELAQQFASRSAANAEPLVSIYYHTHDNIPDPVGSGILQGETFVFRSSFNGDNRRSEDLLLLNPNTGVTRVYEVAKKYAQRQQY